MIRVWIFLGVIISLGGAVLAQGVKPPTTESRHTQATPIVPPAPRRAPLPGSKDQAADDEAIYVIEMKVVEGKGLFGDGSNNPSPNADFPRGFERRTLDKAIASGMLPPPPSIPTTPAVSHPTDSPSSRDLSFPAETVPKSDDETWDIPSDDPSMRTLTAPRITVSAKVPAVVDVQHSQTFNYLEPLGNDKFQLKRTDVQQLGMSISFEVHPVKEDERSVELAPLKIQTTALDGREAVEGLDLDAGKPIIASRSLKTTARLKEGVTHIVAIPSGPAVQAVLLLRFKRMKPSEKN